MAALKGPPYVIFATLSYGFDGDREEFSRTKRGRDVAFARFHADRYTSRVIFSIFG
jgi:hypothetical protein